MKNPSTVTHTNARLKVYPGKTIQQVASEPIFPMTPGASTRPYDVAPPGHALNPARAMMESQRRAKARVMDIALCNAFPWFFTWTLDPKLVDRYSPETVYRKVRSFLSNAVRRKGFAYVAVPEYHQKKDAADKPAIHIHGLCHLGQIPIVRALNRAGRSFTDKHGRPVYHMSAWKWGYSTCVPIDQNYERAVYYVAGYITMADAKIFGKWYLASRNLVKQPELIPLEPVPYDEFRDEAKLARHEQYESKIYGGLHIVTEELPPLEQP